MKPRELALNTICTTLALPHLNSWYGTKLHHYSSLTQPQFGPWGLGLTSTHPYEFDILIELCYPLTQYIGQMLRIDSLGNIRVSSSLLEFTVWY